MLLTTSGRKILIEASCGTVANSELIAPSFTGGTRTFNLGDIAIDISEGVIYGSSNPSSVGGGAYFKIIINGDGTFIYETISSLGLERM